MQIEQEAELNPNEMVFLDRALPDSLAYYRFLELPADGALLAALQRVSYRKVFLLDLLPLAPDPYLFVDLDAALKPKERSVFDPLAWVGGKTEVTASGVVRAQNGKGQLQLESATLGGISIPKSLLQQLVSYYTRTPEEPAGFDIDKPFDLPANITSVEISRGQAIVVQP